MKTNNAIHPETADNLRRLLHKWIDEIPLNKIGEMYSFFKGFFNK